MQASFHGIKIPVEQDETDMSTASPFSLQEMQRAMQRTLEKKQNVKPNSSQDALSGVPNRGA